jgi:hypothetical protein
VPESGLAAHVSEMRDLVRSVEVQVARGDLPPDGVENHKIALDDIRLRLWAVLAAAGGITPEQRQASLQRFRLRRAIDICSGVAADLAGGRISRDHPELSTLREASTMVVENIDDGRPAQP